MKIISTKGNEALMQRRKTAFACSRKTPGKLEYLVGKWLLGLSAERDCIMCGNQSPMEQAVFSVLLQRKIPTILVLAEAMHDGWNGDVENALAEGRLLIITHCDQSVHNVTARSAFDRNILMFSLAAKIVIGYYTKGGKLERALAGFDNVEYLENGQPWLERREEQKPAQAVQQAKPARLGEWNRRIRLKHGHIFLDFNDSGAETYFKITHNVQAGGDEYSRQKMFFDRKELSAFLSAITTIAEKNGKSEPIPQGLSVESLSGEVSFAVTAQDGGNLLTMTQDKEYGGGRHRVNTVALLLPELPMLIKGVDEALKEWKS